MWHMGTAEVVSAWEGQIPKALAGQLGLQCREKRIYTLEYNVRTNNLSLLVLTVMASQRLVSLCRFISVQGGQSSWVSVLISPPITSTATQHRYLSCTVRATPAPSDPCPNMQHGQLSPFKRKRGIWVTFEFIKSMPRKRIPGDSGLELSQRAQHSTKGGKD